MMTMFSCSIDNLVTAGHMVLQYADNAESHAIIFRDRAWTRFSLKGRRIGNQYNSSLRAGVLNSWVLKYVLHGRL